MHGLSKPRVTLLLAALVTTAACSSRLAPPPADAVATIRSVAVRSPLGMVVAASEEPAEVAVAVLQSGGTAVDAAVAAAFVLGTTDPSASGLGGVTQVLLRLASGRIVAIDGTGDLPRATDHARLSELAHGFRERGVDDSVGWEFVAVPGTVAALGHLAQHYGTRPWAELLAPAIAYAEEGFDITVADVSAIENYEATIRAADPLRFWVLDGGDAIPAPGTKVCNRELAAVLRAIAANGPDEFYRGAIARQIEADMIRHGGFVRRADLALYRVVEREPWRATYRGVEVIGFPSPGAGGAVLETLNIVENFAPQEVCLAAMPRLHLLAEASHIVFEDVSRLCRNPDDPYLAQAPVVVSKAFAAERATLLRLGRALTSKDLPASPANPWSVGGTTPLVVADRYGNVVSLSQTLGRFYGAKVLSPSLGFPYNGLLESYSPSVADAARPGGRLLVLMAPTLVLREGKPLLALGASGSSRIPSIIAQVISNVVDCGQSLTAAIDRPRVMWQVRQAETGPHLEVRDEITVGHLKAFKKLGFPFVREVIYPAPRRELRGLGSVNALMVDPRDGSFVGVGDPRRWACALAPEM